MSNDAETAEIPALDEGYSHARKAYGLASALLMAWELIGVELEATPIESLKLTLKSPQAAPYVLITLILYFGFRVTIEWYQNDIRRRSLRASRVDFVVAHAIAVAALALYAFQTLSKIQIANAVVPRVWLSLVLGTVCGTTLHMYLISPKLFRNRMRREWRHAASVLIPTVGSFGLAVWLVYSAGTQRAATVVGICVGVLFAFGFNVLLDLTAARRYQYPLE